jgi:predicted nucleic-acid-binding Zn-ribbon protein
MIRFQPRRVSNVVAGLTVFWCGILSSFFWIKGYNFVFLFMMFLTVLIGFFLASFKTENYQDNIRKKLGFKTSRGLTIEDSEAFSSKKRGVYSSIGEVPFQYTPPARLIRNDKNKELSKLIQNRLPKELIDSSLFLELFTNSIERGKYSKLIKAILEVYCSEGNYNLKAGIDRHNDEFLLTHCLRVAALIFHISEKFDFKDYIVEAKDENFRLDRSDPLLIVIGLAHDLGKIDSFIFDESGNAISIKKGHHKSSCRIVSSLDEFWDESISQEDRYLIQSCCIYTTEYESSPVDISLLNYKTPRAVSDRLQHLIKITLQCDIIASKIENGLKYKFDTDSGSIDLEVIKENIENPTDNKVNLGNKFGEFIAMHAIINGKNGVNSVGFKHIDNTDGKARHLLYIDENEFLKHFCNFLGCDEWYSKESKPRKLTTLTLQAIDDAGYLYRAPEIGHQEAVNCLYKVEMTSGNPPIVNRFINACFIVDVTSWPNLSKIRDLSSDPSTPVIKNSIFGKKFTVARTSIVERMVEEKMGASTENSNKGMTIESLAARPAPESQKHKSKKNKVTLKDKFRNAIKMNLIQWPDQTIKNEEIVVICKDKDIADLGLKWFSNDDSDNNFKKAGIIDVRKSKLYADKTVICLEKAKYKDLFPDDNIESDKKTQDENIIVKEISGNSSIVEKQEKSLAKTQTASQVSVVESQVIESEAIKGVAEIPKQFIKKILIY